MQRSGSRLYANLAGVEVGDGFPVRIVGALNVSPESFFSGSVARDVRALQKNAERMLTEGADILDLGAMSTAPYVDGEISESEEIERMARAVKALRRVGEMPISIDTQRSQVASAALAEGANIINDVSGLYADPEMAKVAQSAQGLILMARERGPSAGEPIVTAGSLLRQSLRRARAAQINMAGIVLDPGIGFYQRGPQPWYEVDCALLRTLSRLRRLGRPLLIGASRKSFIGRMTGRKAPADRLFGSIACAAIAVFNGAALVRTHDIAATLDAVKMAAAIRGDSQCEP
ncbi:MAG TPA: dihydropteroate synthase [Terriglobales bacterium]|nr:dihydropteroate synthase [Terriglobales bacterium]